MKTKKMRKKMMSGLLAAAMTLSMCMGTGVTAFAADVDPKVDAQAAVTKKLVMDEHVTIPAATFKFSVAKIAEGTTTDGNNATVNLETDGPDLKIADLTYSATSGSKTVDGVKVAAQESLLKDSEGNDLTGADFTHAGVYAYTVTETANTYTITDAAKEAMVYSKAEYKVFVVVQNGESGLYISGFTVVQTKKDDGTDGTAKVDPTPGGNETTGDGDSDMEFQNIYNRTGNTVDPTDPNPDENYSKNGALSAWKEVTGALADMTKKFDFSLTVNKPAILDKLVAQSGGQYPAYKATIVDATTGEAIEGAEEVTVTFDKTTAPITKTFKLGHNQKLKFDTLPVGTTYSLTENNGNKITNYDTTITGKADNVAFAETKGTMTTSNKLVGEKANYTKVENNYNDQPITGIVTENLPFILLIAAAVLGFAAYLVVKRRKFVK